MITSGVALRIGYENVFPLLQVEKGKLKRDFCIRNHAFLYIIYKFAHLTMESLWISVYNL